MARSTTTKIVQPLAKGQITIPVAMRRALGITETSMLLIRLEGEQIVISKLGATSDEDVRLYSDVELAEFLAEDVIEPADAEWVRQMLAADLR
jgi:AbrB family looped-hinge helix DNA binding protein